MIKITYPADDFSFEREYIITTLLTDFLGLEISLESSAGSHYGIIGPHGECRIEDHFFRDAPLHYYDDISQIPQCPVKFFSEQFDLEMMLLFGRQYESFDDKMIVCGADIFGSSFFLLTGWEEYALRGKGLVDKHNRVDEEQLFLIKHNIFKVPHVNVYLDYLRALLKQIGVFLSEERNYTLNMSYDIDHIYKWKSVKSIIRAFGGLIRRKRLDFIPKAFLNLIKTSIDRKRDFYFNFKFLQDLLEKNGQKATFYFMAARGTKHNDGYAIEEGRLKGVIKQLVESGHQIGIHPGYQTMEDEQVFLEEFNRLNSALGMTVKLGRQHYLKASLPFTNRSYVELGIEQDSTRGFSNRNGFKTGVCYSFQVFDFLVRKKLPLIESPLIFMDTNTLLSGKSVEEVKAELLDLYQIIKKYRGNFVVLWHNTNLFFPPFDKFQEIHEYIQQNLST